MSHDVTWRRCWCCLDMLFLQVNPPTSFPSPSSIPPHVSSPLPSSLFPNPPSPSSPPSSPPATPHRFLTAARGWTANQRA